MKNLVPVSALVAAALLASCSTVKYNQTDMLATDDAVTSLSFDSVIDMDNVEVVSEIRSTASVTYTRQGMDETVEGEGFKLTRTGAGEFIPDDGSVFKIGSLESMVRIAPAAEAVPGLFFGGVKKADSEKTYPKDLALQMATYDLIVACAEAGGDAVWLPSYVWTEKRNVEMKKSALMTSRTGTVTYTVVITAKAVRFIAAPDSEDSSEE